jgi:flagellar protein FliO/FliZ
VIDAFICERNEALLASLGIESSAAQYLIAFIVIFTLLAGFALVLRKMTGAKARMIAPERNRNQKPRLGVIDVYDLDPTRQLVLLRRDNIEHLLLIGGPNDVVVESNIVKLAGPRVKHLAEAPEMESAEEKAHSAEPSQPSSLSHPLSQTLPEKKKLGNVARPVLRREMAASVVAVVAEEAVTASQPEQNYQEQDYQNGRSPFEKTPSSTMSESNVDDSSAPPSLKEENLEILSSVPTIDELPVEPAPEAAATPIGDIQEQDIQQIKDMDEEPRDHQSLDAAILSDMAKQLEEALRKPVAETAAPVPPPAPPAGPVMNRFNRPVMTTRPVFTPEPPSEIAAPVAQTPSEPVVESVIEAKTPDVLVPPKIKQAPPAQSVSQTPPQAAPKVKEKAPEPQKQAPDAPSPETKKPDPFSIDEIEAEFARLLGRGPGKTP